MTENECIETLKLNRPFAYSELQNAIDIAIQAIEEIQQYRATGTVEKLSKIKELYDKAKWLLDDERKKRRSYEAIGTIEEFKALKNKHIGKDNMVISSSDLMTILNSDSEELKSLKDENAYLHSELQAIGATADMFEKEIRNKAIDEFAERLKNQLQNWSETNYALGQKGDDEAWGSSKAYDNAIDLIDEIAEEMRGAEWK